MPPPQSAPEHAALKPDVNTMAQNSDGAARPRGRGRSFQPGQSGNPGGWPKAIAGVRDLAQGYVTRVVLVTDDAILNAQEALWNVVRIVAEPGGAAALAAVLSGQYRPQPNERVGILVSGGNTTVVDFRR